jgi:CHAT domain-containing protein
VLQDQGELPAARQHYEEALAIYRKALPKDHPDIAGSLHNLGIVLGALGELPAARQHYEEALAIFRKALPKDHPAIAHSLAGLGTVLYAQGELPAARQHYEEALAIFRQALPPDHPDQRFGLWQLFRIHWDEGQLREALQALQEYVRLVNLRQEYDALARSERQQLRIAAQAWSHVSLALQLLLQQGLTADAYDLLLSWKGSVTARQRWLRLQRELAGDAKLLLQELRAVDQHLLTLGLQEARASAKAPANPLPVLHDLTARRDALERQLAAQSPAFRGEKRRARRRTADLTQSLPPKAALLDFVEFPCWELPPPGKGSGVQLKETRLGAFVLRPNEPPCWVELGPTLAITRYVSAWRASYGAGKQPAKDSPDPAVALRKLVWAPLEEKLGGAKVILLAPDGDLTGLPFAALPGSKPGSFLLEEYTFVTIPVPQLLPDLLADPGPQPQRPTALLLVGDVDFGQPETTFQRLPATRTEINDIRDSFQTRFQRPPQELRKTAASKQAVLAQLGRHNYLHLATHGFFADEKVESVFQAAARSPDLRAGLRLHQDVGGELPGLLSGVVFAGANEPDVQKRSASLLTALEASELDLRGVELVVLSACDTGRGRVAGGEGVLGLQRAFQVAGARTAVASLWAVQDGKTQELMSRFYEGLWDATNPLGKAEALRRAQLALLREGYRAVPRDEPGRGPTPPYYWAAFVLSGDWR